MHGKRSGHLVLEFAFFLPYLIFLFVGAFDWGFYAEALVETENAARVAAIYTSSSSTAASDSAGACTRVLNEMADAPGVNGLSSCSNSTLTVTASAVTGPDGANASQVSVAYRTIQGIPIIGALTGRITITRTVIMRVRG